MPYTSGPWEAQRGDPYDCTWEINSTGARWGAIANVNANTNGSLHIDDETAEANARLIAAAPDLLAVCEATLKRVKYRLDQIDATHAEFPFLADLEGELLTAIAKARGE